MTYDIVILTDSKHAYPNTIDDYTKNVITEDALLANALGKLGLIVTRRSWNDPTFDWASTKAVLFRTTWDYFNAFPQFSKWLNKTSKLTTLLNSEKIIRWNLDKHYLKDLCNKGVTIADTYFIEKGDPRDLETIHKTLNWSHTVLKPCISGGARHTYKLNHKNIANHNAVFKSLIAHEAMMLQPFQNNIVSQGEKSLMVFNGTFTHAILKKAKPGDFRVQDDFGGTVSDYTPTNEEITFAEHAVKACIEPPIYARVDIFNNNDNQIALAELELIEPELWFRHYPKATLILAKALQEKLSLL